MAKKPRPRLSGMPVTLADVAREARVSQITVSRVIRNKGAISGEMRRRVEEVIREVGYVPNRLAGSLASAGTDSSASSCRRSARSSSTTSCKA